MTTFTELNRRGKTIVLVTHDPDVAAVANRTIRMADGEIVADEAGRGAELAGSGTAGRGAERP